MANGWTRETHSHGHPRIYQRWRPRVLEQSEDSFSKAEFLGYILSVVLKIGYGFIVKLFPSWIKSWFHWCPTSPQVLEIEEQAVLSSLKRPYTGQFINIGKCCGKEDNYIWTVSLNQHAEKLPIVLLHDFARGVGFWAMNLDSLASSRPVHAVDLLGFGRSSRPEFSSNALEAEMQFFISLEKWRTAMGLERFILLGHSMGGYIAASYALHYPERVALLILVDPWGLTEKEISVVPRYELDSWVKFINSFLNGFNFLAVVRAVGPLGPFLVRMFRSDLKLKFGHFLDEPVHMMNYLYHCNSQEPRYKNVELAHCVFFVEEAISLTDLSRKHGEAAFKSLTDKSGWPKHPMMYRLNSLNWKVPITFVYGSRSWCNRQPALQIKYSRLNSYVDVQVIEGAGHHVYADKPEQFNVVISRVCESLENGLIQPTNL